MMLIDNRDKIDFGHRDNQPNRGALGVIRFSSRL